MNEMNLEHLLQAMHTAEFTCESLKGAHAGCSLVESLILLPIMDRAQAVRRDISALVSALQ